MAYDVAVIGLGAAGSAALLQLARRGVRVIGFDRFTPPHSFGSSAGETRITRLAIGEGEHLTPLVQRSHAIWGALERETGAELLTQTGGLIISSRHNPAQTHVDGFFDRTVAAARQFGIEHQLLSAAEIRARWPQFQVRDDEFGYFEPAAGFVRPERCIETQLNLARANGAALRLEEPVLAVEFGKSGVAIKTERGRYDADRVSLSAGAGLPQLLGEQFTRHFRVYRQVQAWFAVQDGAAFTPEQFPVFIWELPNSDRGLYGFPSIDGGASIKVASEQFAATTNPQQVDRTVSAEEINTLAALVAPNLPSVGPVCAKAQACLYTVTPDFGFVIDRHPHSERATFVSACSGHGFKHSPAIGEAVAQLTLGETPQFDLSPFSLARLRA